MRIKGKTFDSPNYEVIIVPRPDGDIIFKASAVLDFDRFNKLCPVPNPPMVTYAGAKTPVPDFKDKDYNNALSERGRKRFNWILIQSLKATPDLEWDSIDEDNPDTWEKIEAEFRAAKFSEVEIGRIFSGVLAANSLDEERIEEARKRFLASQQPQSNQ
jgi:hypothetical protein